MSLIKLTLTLAALLLVSASGVAGQSSWSKISAVLTSNPAPNNGALATRYYSAGFSLFVNGNSNLYVVQGQANLGSDIVPTISVSSNAGATWSDVIGTGQIPFQRLGHVATATVTATSAGNAASPYTYQINVLGGVDVTGVYGDVWTSTDLMQTWSQRNGQYDPRYFHGGAVYNNGASTTVLVFGGLSVNTGDVLADTYFSNNGGESFIQRSYTLNGGQTTVAPWAARQGFAYATTYVAGTPTIVIVGGATDPSATAYVGDVWYTFNDGIAWQQTQTLASLARVWASAAFIQSTGRVVVAGGLLSGNVISGDVFVASNANFQFTQETQQVGASLPARFGQTLVSTSLPLGSTAQNEVYSIGGRTNVNGLEIITNDVFRYNPVAGSTPVTTYTYQFVGYLNNLCYVDNTFGATCGTAGSTGVRRPQFQCVVSTSNLPSQKQPNDDGSANNNDPCLNQAVTRPTVAAASCTLGGCFTLFASGVASQFCSVQTFTTGCSNSVGFGQTDSSRTFTQQYYCRDVNNNDQLDNNGNIVVAYPFQTVAANGAISYGMNPASSCFGLTIPTFNVDTTSSCTVNSCTVSQASVFAYLPLPDAQQSTVASNCRVGSNGIDQCTAPLSGQGGFYKLTFACIETNPVQGVPAQTYAIGSAAANLYCANQLPPSNQLAYNLPKWACPQLVSCTNFYYASVGYGQCTAGPVSAGGANRYCYDVIGSLATTPVPEAYQFAVYQCFQGGVAVAQANCINAGVSQPSNVDRVACTLLPCISGATYLPIGIGQCVSTANSATCCQRDSTLPLIPKPGFSTTNQPMCSTLQGQMQAPTLYQCTYRGDGYPGQCVAPYPTASSAGSSYYQSCTLPFCGIQGDPEFVGFRGQRYEIHGVPNSVFNIISAPTVQYNAEFVFLGAKSERECNTTRTHPWTHPGTYLGTLGFKIGAERVQILPGDCQTGIKSVTVNGKELSVGEVHHFKGAQKQVLSFSDEFTVHMALTELDITLENSDNFFNQAVSLTKIGQRTKTMHGLLGQTWSTKTYRDEAGHKHFIEGHPNDYMIQDDDVFGDDFMFNLFKQ